MYIVRPAHCRKSDYVIKLKYHLFMIKWKSVNIRKTKIHALYSHLKTLLENWLIATNFLVTKWANLVTKTICDWFYDRFSLSHISRLQIYLRLIFFFSPKFLQPIQGNHVPCLSWLFVNILRLIFQLQIPNFTIEKSITDLQFLGLKNRSQMWNSICLLPYIFNGKH